MGIDDEDGHLAKLHQRVEASVSELGFPPERRKYRGHITLGRIRSRHGDNEELQQFIKDNAASEFGCLSVHKVTVYHSKLSRDGPHYTIVGGCPLGGSPSQEEN